jgi:hypothetical protein
MLKNLSKWVFSLLVIGFFQCHSQTNDLLILGKWKGVKKELKNGETGENYTSDGKPYSNPMTISFNDDGTGYEEYGDEDFIYEIKDEYINIGNRTFVIEKLDKSELILLEFDKYTPNDPLATRLYFERISNDKS